MASRASVALIALQVNLRCSTVSPPARPLVTGALKTNILIREGVARMAVRGYAAAKVTPRGRTRTPLRWRRAYRIAHGARRTNLLVAAMCSIVKRAQLDTIPPWGLGIARRVTPIITRTKAVLAFLAQLAKIL